MPYFSSVRMLRGHDLYSQQMRCVSNPLITSQAFVIGTPCCYNATNVIATSLCIDTFDACLFLFHSHLICSQFVSISSWRRQWQRERSGGRKTRKPLNKRGSVCLSRSNKTTRRLHRWRKGIKHSSTILVV